MGRRITNDEARASLKEVTIGEHDYLIRKLAADEMVSLGFIPAEVVSGKITSPQAGMDAAMGPDLSARINAVIAASVVEPRIWIGTMETCPAEEVWVGFLGEDRDALVSAIYDHSKLKEDLEKAARFLVASRVGRDAVGAVPVGGDDADGTPQAVDHAGVAP